MNRKFNIDFFEFSFLVEACLPPRPIARTMFFRSVSEEYYHIMDADERKRLFEWIIKNPNFKIEEDDCLNFYDRFNPDNQYKVSTDFDGKKEDIEAYLHDGQYYTSNNTWIAEEYITKVKKL